MPSYEPTQVDIELLENVAATLLYHTKVASEEGNIYSVQAMLIAVFLLVRAPWEELDFCRRAANLSLEKIDEVFSIVDVLRQLGGDVREKKPVKIMFAKTGLLDHAAIEQIVRAVNILRVYSACPASYARDILLEVLKPHVTLEEVRYGEDSL